MSKKGIVIIGIGIYAAIIAILRDIFQSIKIGIWFELAIAIAFPIVWIAVLNYIFKKHKVGGCNEDEKIEVSFFNAADVTDKVLKYAVIMTQYNEKWIFVRHKDRNTWEIPGGRREPNEEILKTAERELVEETGAKRFEIKPVCVYSVTRNLEKSYGLLCYADIHEFGNPLEMEICEIKQFEELPNMLTYPLIQAELYKKIIAYRVQTSMDF